MEQKKQYKIAVAGTGYVGMSMAVLLSQHHEVTAVDIVQEKVDLINSRKSPIQDEYIETYLAQKELRLSATMDAEAAYTDADFIVIAAPTNYDSRKTCWILCRFYRRSWCVPACWHRTMILNRIKSSCRCSRGMCR